MDRYMKEVVREDKLARKKIELAKMQLTNINSSISDVTAQTHEQLLKDEQEKMALLRREADQEIEAVQSKCEKETAAGLKSLKKQYEENKDMWIDSIVKNILG